MPLDSKPKYNKKCKQGQHDSLQVKPVFRPTRTYQPMSKNLVWIEVKDENLKTLVIRREAKGEVIVEHLVSSEKGKLIQNRHHIRDRSKGIENLKQRLVSHFENQPLASAYLDEISQRYPRYRRDQFAIIYKVTQQYPLLIDTVLTKCMKENLYNANDFRDIAHHLNTLWEEQIEDVQPIYISPPKQFSSQSFYPFSKCIYQHFRR